MTRFPNSSIDYIFGNNISMTSPVLTRGEKIEMTSPVLSRKHQSGQ